MNGLLPIALDNNHNHHQHHQQHFKMTANARENRDIYLQYMRLDNPDYSLFTVAELKTALNNIPTSKKPTKRRQCRQKHCGQEHDGVAGAYLGVEKGALHLWRSGSVINYVVRKDGWSKQRRALHVLVAAHQAAECWNAAMDGRLTFRFVENLCDAAFEVRYEHDGRRGHLASAFFPLDHRRDLNFLRIYRSAFSSKYSAKYPLVNILTHELGHVVGLRHEFASKTEQQSEAILFGIHSRNSVMSYKTKPVISESDVEVVRRAYDELEDGHVIKAQGPLGLIMKIVSRVEPNN